MNSKYLESVDFSRHERWLSRTLGPEVVLLVLNADGDVVWNQSHPLASVLATALRMSTCTTGRPISRRSGAR